MLQMTTADVRVDELVQAMGCRRSANRRLRTGGPEKRSPSPGGPRVRILLPPGESPLRTWTTDDSGVLGQCRWETEPSAVSPGIDHDDIRKSGFEINGQILPGAVPFPWNTREALSPSLSAMIHEKMLGWTRAPAPEARPFLPARMPSSPRSGALPAAAIRSISKTSCDWRRIWCSTSAARPQLMFRWPIRCRSRRKFPRC